MDKETDADDLKLLSSRKSSKGPDVLLPWLPSRLSTAEADGNRHYFCKYLVKLKTDSDAGGEVKGWLEL